MGSRYYYNETFEDQTFDASESGFSAGDYVKCTFKNCIFKDGDNMNLQVTALIQSDNKLIDCWYNPVLILTKIINSLHDDVNILDFINRSLIKSSKNRHKQLVLLDILDILDPEKKT